MLVTHFGILHLPEPYATGLRHRRISSLSYNEAIEVIGWLKGESVDREIARKVLINRRLRSDLEEVKSLPDIQDDYIIIKPNDGEAIQVSASYLRRHFHFFDDFLSSFPDEKEVSIPYPRKVLIDSIKYVPEMYLSVCRECLHYLNPKNPMYYLMFDTEGTSPNHILELYSLLSESDRASIMKARRILRSSLVPPPNEGLGLGCLAIILEECWDFDNLFTIFSDYPSYLTVTSAIAIEQGHEKILGDFTSLLKSDFGSPTEIEESSVINSQITEALIYSMTLALEKIDNWKDMQRVLTMVGVTCEAFGNHKDYVVAPYHLDLRFAGYLTKNYRIVNKIALFLDISSVQVVSELYSISQRR